MRTRKGTGRKTVATALAILMAWGVSFSSLAAEQKTKYAFVYQEQQVEVGMAADAAFKILGKGKSSKILVNCADDSGSEKAYIYDNFEIVTTKQGKKEVVKEILLTGGEVSTEEGIKVGDLPSAVKKAYPEAKGEMGLYTVTLGETQLLIDCGLKDDKVVTITYLAAEKK